MSGGSPPVGGDEALEQQVDLGGIDAGDAEAEAHRAVGGRAAALAQDGLAAGEAHDVVDGEEIARVVEPGDQRQLLGEERAHLCPARRRDSARAACAQVSSSR